ncbi:MAG TPA: hypothetical protein VEF55_04205 [Candidatus Binatia bacterium]|nr:hypothetical protein [Candidatus Binatia bacterium]
MDVVVRELSDGETAMIAYVTLGANDLPSAAKFYGSIVTAARASDSPSPSTASAVAIVPIETHGQVSI